MFFDFASTMSGGLGPSCRVFGDYSVRYDLKLTATTKTKISSNLGTRVKEFGRISLSGVSEVMHKKGTEVVAADESNHFWVAANENGGANR